MTTDVELKPQVYRDPRPAEYFAPFHQRVRPREPEAKVYEVVRALTVMHALITYRARAFGSENVPIGPVILAPNHASFLDHFFVGGFIRRRVQFMAKSQLFTGVGTWIFSHGGVFPVRRGARAAVFHRGDRRHGEADDVVGRAVREVGEEPYAAGVMLNLAHVNAEHTAGGDRRH